RAARAGPSGARLVATGCAPGPENHVVPGGGVLPPPGTTLPFKEQPGEAWSSGRFRRFDERAARRGAVVLVVELTGHPDHHGGEILRIGDGQAVRQLLGLVELVHRLVHTR